MTLWPASTGTIHAINGDSRPVRHQHVPSACIWAVTARENWLGGIAEGHHITHERHRLSASYLAIRGWCDPGCESGQHQRQLRLPGFGRHDDSGPGTSNPGYQPYHHDCGRHRARLTRRRSTSASHRASTQAPTLPSTTTAPLRRTRASRRGAATMAQRPLAQPIHHQLYAPGALFPVGSRLVSGGDRRRRCGQGDCAGPRRHLLVSASPAFPSGSTTEVALVPDGAGNATANL